MKPFQSMSRTGALIVAIFSLTATACFGSTDADANRVARAEVSEQSRRVLEAAEDVGALFTGVDSTSDLSLAWDDLNSDLKTVVSDLARNSDSLDVEGFSSRMRGLSEGFTSLNDPVLEERWGRLLSAFDRFVAVVDGVPRSASANVVADS